MVRIAMIRRWPGVFLRYSGRAVIVICVALFFATGVLWLDRYNVKNQLVPWFFPTGDGFSVEYVEPSPEIEKTHMAREWTYDSEKIEQGRPRIIVSLGTRKGLLHLRVDTWLSSGETVPPIHKKLAGFEYDQWVAIRSIESHASYTVTDASRVREGSLPFWFILLLFGGYPVATGALFAYRVGRRRKYQRQGRCVECGYNLLHNTSGTCPECGCRGTGPAPEQAQNVDPSQTGLRDHVNGKED
jgi:hypothetical protein